ncbi:YihY family inner membrane protein [Chlorobium sp. N1]|uniref:YihY family inner membrane protein n=1 Tax=Chlorobium sp. N1 TaxID=2491138 RepID=UPI00103D86C3|nr:YihY family inner membrane protein [Chlorobium sp. N1]TCD48504.1 YihY family inner membrane protein [Chlorobium sp. N1]
MASGTSSITKGPGRWLRAAGDFLRSFVPFLFQNFVHDRIFLSAGSLAFQTLLSIVPLLAVVLSVLNVFAVFAPFQPYVEDFIVSNFVPGTGGMIREYFSGFIGNTFTMPFFGALFLFIVALVLLSTVDSTLNEIWEVHSPRKALQGFTLYWTVLTLGPILFAASLTASSFVWYTVFTQGPLVELKTRLLSFLPSGITALALLLLYLLVPNRRVRFLHALTGALLATLLFEISRRWFAFYVSNVATFEHIYGALSVIPMLFFWIYLGWVVVLSGAEVVYCLGARRPSGGAGVEFDPLRGVPLVLAVLGFVLRLERQGGPVDMKKILREFPRENPSSLRKIVDILLDCRFVHLTAGGGMAVTGDLHSLTLYDLYCSLPPDFGAEEFSGRDPAGDGAELQGVRERLGAFLSNEMRVPLLQLMEGSNEGPA